jgi:hypothetical protein
MGRDGRHSQSTRPAALSLRFTTMRPQTRPHRHRNKTRFETLEHSISTHYGTALHADSPPLKSYLQSNKIHKIPAKNPISRMSIPCHVYRSVVSLRFAKITLRVYDSQSGTLIREDGEICACAYSDGTVSHIKHRINIFQKHVPQNTNPIPRSPRLYRPIAILAIQLLPQ